MPPPDDRFCQSCGRRIEWRAKWARDWESVSYCSDACKRTKVRAVDLALEGVIVEILKTRAGGATCCPSEAARQVGGDDWRPLMEPARRAARRLTNQGVAQITQKGQVVDPSSAKGPIRVRLVRPAPADAADGA